MPYHAPKFIKLTEVNKTKGERPIIFNTSFIQSIKKSDTGPDTHVCMGGKDYFYVKESLEEVERLIG